MGIKDVAGQSFNNAIASIATTGQRVPADLKCYLPWPLWVQKSSIQIR